MPKLTGNCLCGNVSFVAEGDIAMMGNCHCTDCQQISGSTHATLVFMAETDVAISGETKRFEHSVDSGNTLTFLPELRIANVRRQCRAPRKRRAQSRQH